MTMTFGVILKRNWRFELYTDISPDTEECIVLKFILQPIVENSIKYAFGENALYGTITIESFHTENDLFIHVQDDGEGMTDSQLADLTSNLNDFSTFGKHVGLKNIHQRIQLAFGDEYGISIESKVGFGTSVHIRMPYTKDRNDFPKNANDRSV